MNLEALVIPLKWAKENFDAGITDIKGKLSKVGKVAATLTGAGISALSAGIAVTTKKALDWGNTLDSIQDHLASTAEESAGLALLFQTVGGNVEQLTSGMDVLTRGLLDAEGGLGKSGKALQSLGIEIYGANGKLKSSVELWQEIADKLSAMPDGLEKNALLMEIFGKRGVELGDALNATANGGMQAFIDKANSMGLVFDQEQIDKTIEFQKKMETLNGAVDGLKVTFGILLIEAIEPVIQKFTEWLVNSKNQQKIKDLAGVISKDLTNAFKTVADVMTFVSNNKWALDLIGGITSVGAAFFATSKVLGLFGLTLAGLGAPVIALIGAIGLLIFVILRFGKDAWNTITMVSELIRIVFGELIKRNIETLVNVFNAVKNAIIGVVNWIGTLINKLKSIKIPDLLKPGSPTPFELGLRGIGSAMKELSTEVIPELQTRMKMEIREITAPQSKPAPVYVNTSIDEVKLAYAIRDVVLKG